MNNYGIFSERENHSKRLKQNQIDETEYKHIQRDRSSGVIIISVVENRSREISIAKINTAMVIRYKYFANYLIDTIVLAICSGDLSTHGQSFLC
jgi:hypothetical protein